MIKKAGAKVYAPIVLFVYKRLEHTIKTVNALKNNHLSWCSDLIVYSDAPKSDLDVEQVQNVRDYLCTIEGFASIKIVERAENQGLAKSITQGVSNVIEAYGKVIVLEDDIVTSPYFLMYMNQALDKYQDEESVWHISGWNHPIDSNKINGDSYFGYWMNCWGWATWASKWKHFDKDPKRLIESWSDSKISKFNLDGIENYWGQVERNFDGSLNSWAIFWYATIFDNNGLCLNPVDSLVVNIGFDGSGENCGEQPFYSNEFTQSAISLPKDVAINSDALEQVKFYIKNSRPTFFIRLINKIKRTFFN